MGTHRVHLNQVLHDLAHALEVSVHVDGFLGRVLGRWCPVHVDDLPTVLLELHDGRTAELPGASGHDDNGFLRCGIELVLGYGECALRGEGERAGHDDDCCACSDALLREDGLWSLIMRL